MTFNPSESYGDDRVLLTVKGEYAGHEVQAYCSPNSDGELYFSDGEMVNEDAELPTFYQMKNGAPFDFDVVLVNDVYPQEGEIEELAEALGSAFNEGFHERVDDVFQLIEGSDDPLDAIKDLDPDDVVVAPTYREE
jgi:hypothetical protein